MFVEFFSRPKRKSLDDLLKKARGSCATAPRGGSPKASMVYLLNKPEGEMRVLGDSPKLSVQLAENLDFQNKYTVGCLTFEEPKIPEDQKYEIMQRFEDVFLAG